MVLAPVRAALEETIDRTTRSGLPAELIVSKVREGLAKGVPPESIITGSEKTSFIPALAGSGNRQSYEWVIKGKPGSTVTLKAVSQKGGTDTSTLSLR